MVKTCPICGKEVEYLLDIKAIFPPGLSTKPIEGVVLNIPTYLCKECILLIYDKNIPKEYWKKYNHLRFSTNKKTLHLAVNLLKYLDFTPRKVLGIGEFDNSFLKKLKEEFSPELLVGIDPAYPSEGIEEDIILIKDFFPSEKLRKFERKFELIVVRNVIECIPNLEQFVKHLNSYLSPEGVVLIEFPNWLQGYRIYPFYFSTDRYWDFSKYSVLKLFEDFFSPLLEVETDYYIGIFTKGRTLSKVYSSITPQNAKDLLVHKREEIVNKLIKAFKDYEKIIIWGAGRSISDLIRELKGRGIDENRIIVVDCNPKKEGLYVAGTGIKVQNCEILKNNRKYKLYPVYINSYAVEEIRKLAKSWGLKILEV